MYFRRERCQSIKEKENPNTNISIKIAKLRSLVEIQIFINLVIMWDEAK